MPVTAFIRNLSQRIVNRNRSSVSTSTANAMKSPPNAINGKGSKLNGTPYSYSSKNKKGSDEVRPRNDNGRTLDELQCSEKNSSTPSSSFPISTQAHRTFRSRITFKMFEKSSQKSARSTRSAKSSKIATKLPDRDGMPFCDPSKECLCQVKILDGTLMNFVLLRKSLGKELYERVFDVLDLDEKDYFGLQFTDEHHVQLWLDPLKKIEKQQPRVQKGVPYLFQFRVKFFSSEPNNLRDELTRYHFFLQLKNDIFNGKLECPLQMASELAAFALQSEFGDFNPVEHDEAFVSEFRFHPKQDEHMEMSILDYYRSKCVGLSPEQAELTYLNKAKTLEMYGVDIHTVEGRDGNKYELGLTPIGMFVFDGQQKIGLFHWEKIQRLDFKKQRLTLVVEEDDINDQTPTGHIQLHTFVFQSNSIRACKHLWKCAVEFHTFFRLPFHRPPKQRTVQLFRLGSTFKHRGHTEYENINREKLCFTNSDEDADPHIPRKRSHCFYRRSSQRYAPRQSHLLRRRQRHHQQQRHSVIVSVDDEGHVLVNNDDEFTTNCEGKNQQNGLQLHAQDALLQSQPFLQNAPSNTDIGGTPNSKATFDVFETTFSKESNYGKHANSVTEVTDVYPSTSGPDMKSEFTAGNTSNLKSTSRIPTIMANIVTSRPPPQISAINNVSRSAIPKPQLRAFSEASNEKQHVTTIRIKEFGIANGVDIAPLRSSSQSPPSTNDEFTFLAHVKAQKENDKYINDSNMIVDHYQAVDSGMVSTGLKPTQQNKSHTLTSDNSHETSFNMTQIPTSTVCNQRIQTIVENKSQIGLRVPSTPCSSSSRIPLYSSTQSQGQIQSSNSFSLSKSTPSNPYKSSISASLFTASPAIVAASSSQEILSHAICNGSSISNQHYSLENGSLIVKSFNNSTKKAIKQSQLPTDLPKVGIVNMTATNERYFDDIPTHSSPSKGVKNADLISPISISNSAEGKNSINANMSMIPVLNRQQKDRRNNSSRMSYL